MVRSTKKGDHLDEKEITCHSAGIRTINNNHFAGVGSKP